MNSSNITSLLWLLGIGALFYWMMRKGGCGMHAGHSHGGHEHHESGHGTTTGPAGHESHRATNRDPVCGMQVDPNRAAGVRRASGQTLYFCSNDCLEKFDRDPEGYARREAETTESGNHGGGHRHAGCC